MSDLTNEIILRPRFELSVPHDIEKVNHIFDVTAKEPFLIKRIDEHIYIRFIPSETTFWSPQLHLELSSFEKGSSNIHGLFGPNPTLWTFFMFLHFGVGTLFVILGIFAYSKYSLGHNVTPWLIGMIFLVFIWFALYAFGRMGKSKGKGQMDQLKGYLNELLKDIEVRVR